MNCWNLFIDLWLIKGAEGDATVISTVNGIDSQSSNSSRLHWFILMNDSINSTWDNIVVLTQLLNLILKKDNSIEITLHDFSHEQLWKYTFYRY